MYPFQPVERITTGVLDHPVLLNFPSGGTCFPTDISLSLETWALVSWNGLDDDKIITKALCPCHSMTQDKDANDVEITKYMEYQASENKQE